MWTRLLLCIKKEVTRLVTSRSRWSVTVVINAYVCMSCSNLFCPKLQRSFFVAEISCSCFTHSYSGTAAVYLDKNFIVAKVDVVWWITSESNRLLVICYCAVACITVRVKFTVEFFWNVLIVSSCIWIQRAVSDNDPWPSLQLPVWHFPV